MEPQTIYRIRRRSQMLFVFDWSSPEDWNAKGQIYAERGRNPICITGERPTASPSTSIVGMRSLFVHQSNERASRSSKVPAIKTKP